MHAELNSAALQPLYDACEAQNNAIDILLVMLINRDKTFRPTQSPAWPAITLAAAARTKALALATSLGELPADVRKLVIAARIVSLEDQSPEALRHLDQAAETFADRVPWEDDPNDQPDF